MNKWVDKIFLRVANHCGASCLKEHHDKMFFGGASPHFIRMNYQSIFYSSYGTYNPFTIYRQ